MTDLHHRFATLDAIPTRLDWADVERRATADATSVMPGRPTLRGSASTPRRSWTPSRALVFLVAAMVLATVAGTAALVGSRLWSPDGLRPSLAPSSALPSLTPAPSISARPTDRPVSADEDVAALFDLPFAYRQNPDVALRSAERTRYQFAAAVAADASVSPTLKAIDVVSIHEPFVHACLGHGGSSRVTIRDDAAGFLEDLQVVGGAVLRDQRLVLLGAHEAVAARLESACTPDFHLNSARIGGLTPPGTYVPLKLGSELYVVEVAGSTVVIVVWADSMPEVTEWLPVATEFVESFRFVDRP